FQAEDGIRDDLVTGVQTCALPIWSQWIRLAPPHDVAGLIPMEMKGEGGHRTSRLEGPGIRIQVGKGRIAFFDLRQPGGFVSAYAVSVRAFEHRAEPIKRPDVLLHPRLRVVLRGDRRNQEGPVRCLQEEELSRELRQDSTRDWTLAPANRPRGLDERIFRAIHFLPNPARVVIQPDPMMTALAPRAFREADRGTRRMLG